MNLQSNPIDNYSQRYSSHVNKRQGQKNQILTQLITSEVVTTTNTVKSSHPNKLSLCSFVKLYLELHPLLNNAEKSSCKYTPSSPSDNETDHRTIFCPHPLTPSYCVRFNKSSIKALVVTISKKYYEE